MTVSGVLEAQRRTVESVDLDRRIARLEAAARREDNKERLQAQSGERSGVAFASGFGAGLAADRHA